MSASSSAASSQRAWATAPDGRIWLSVVFPSLSVIANAGLVGGSRFAGERRLRRDVERQRSNLARYHSPLVADMLAQDARVAELLGPYRMGPPGG